MRNISSRGVVILAAGALLASIATGSAAIAKGPGNGNGHHTTSGSGGGTISLVLVNDANGNGSPNYGDTVTFNVSTTATDQPWVNLQCFQNKVLVAQGWNGFFDGSITGRNFGLYSGAWSGGAADCTAYLDNPQWSVLASTSFHVDG
jgi:hypothetical protein